ncbi:MAG: tRNA pseudouridine(55) synthase TruB, partial [Bdellovibrionales bacterium]|nr:tRNA pseudouridine(55) synthase TruB [Bdellovibrionales bacterium]
LDKPTGLSSAQAIARVKHRLNIGKIGHAGTLDPDASGLLVCLLNSATRLVSFAQAGRKKYTGIIRLGITTTSDDLQGEILTKSDYVPSDEQVEIARRRLTGKIMQIPPQISAVKVNGKRSYALSRKGETVALSPRPAEIYSFSLSRLDPMRFTYVVETSPGTYVRSLARDLGEMLGSGGCIESLRREASYPFDVSQSITLDELSIDDILSPDRLLPNAGVLALRGEQVKRLRSGDQSVLSVIGVPEGEATAFYADSCSPNELLGLLHCNGQDWKLALNL